MAGIITAGRARRANAALEAIVGAKHGDPFAVLGMHKSGSGLQVRAFLPEAEAMSVVDSANGEVVADARRVHPDGMFVAAIARRPEPFRYRLRVTRSSHQYEFEDIYRFPPVLGDLDLHLLVEGNHLASYQKLGAHTLVHDGVEGVALAVWAPNAQ